MSDFKAQMEEARKERAARFQSHSKSDASSVSSSSSSSSSSSASSITSSTSSTSSTASPYSFSSSSSTSRSSSNSVAQRFLNSEYITSLQRFSQGKLIINSSSHQNSSSSKTPSFIGSGNTTGYSSAKPVTGGASTEDAICLSDEDDDATPTEHPSAQKKRPPPPSAKTTVIPLTILTQNLWFHENNQKVRMKSFLTQTNQSSTPPHFICVQEQTASLIDHIEDGARELGMGEMKFQSQVTYASSSSGIGIDLQYGCGIYTHPSQHPHPNDWNVDVRGSLNYNDTAMARGLTFNVITHKSGLCSGIIGTTHFESYVLGVTSGSSERKSQLLECLQFVERGVGEGGVGFGVICGDMNWDDVPKISPKTKKPLKVNDSPMIDILNARASSQGRWIDLWVEEPVLAFDGDVRGFTFDSVLNPGISGKNVNGMRKRFDRILLYVREGEERGGGRGRVRVKVKGCEIVNKAVIGGGVKKKSDYPPTSRMFDVCCSDHYGVKGELEIVVVGEEGEGKKLRR